ncbi:uncharacterized protein LOC132062446 [Lycium ferocissimum]|uniref:uncharacterized protein LOC132062446 n=1 Tax=Lycium ferocissimum TaxID=112874 RepID=UPI0028164BA8|nr:uncharacterized protein LOC132062446 [Lycium ferocissimum]
MHNKYRFCLTGLMEPFQQAYKLDSYRRRLGLKTALCNISGKIWAFVDEDHEVTVLIDSVQQMTLKLENCDTHAEIIVTLVYAKCDRIERIELWEPLYHLASDMTLPWLVGGDFNVITDEKEMYGGMPVTLNEVEDFRHCIQTCNLTDLGYKGSIFTWWNGRGAEDYVFKRLDRCLGNFEFQQHSPLLLECKQQVQQFKKSFKFLNFWTKHETFLEVVKENWETDLQKVLSTWSKSTYGDIFQKITNLEEVVKDHEAIFESNPSYSNKEKLMKVQAELTRVLHLEEEFWKQKAGISWFQEGDKNSKFFHAYVNGRRKFLLLNRIQDSTRTWLDSEDDITKEVKDPTKHEVKQVVFGLNYESASGPDGYTSLFFQKCSDIVGDDMFNMEYKQASGQMINKSKSSIYLHDRVDEEKNSTRYLVSSFGAILLVNEADIGLDGILHVCLKMKVVWDLDHLVTCQWHCLPNCGGISGLNHLCGVHS